MDGAFSSEKTIKFNATSGVGIDCMAFGENGYDRMKPGRDWVVIP